MTKWIPVNGEDIEQGDLLKSLYIPVIRPDFPRGEGGNTIDAVLADVIIATQSCDLINGKVKTALVARAMSIAEFGQTNTNYQPRKSWNKVIRGEIASLHVLASPDAPEDRSKLWVIDFREIYGLPVPYLKNFAAQAGNRWRLNPPYLEHFSHALGRFFSRVALPGAIEEFR